MTDDGCPRAMSDGWKRCGSADSEALSSASTTGHLTDRELVPDAHCYNAASPDGEEIPVMHNGTTGGRLALAFFDRMPKPKNDGTVYLGISDALRYTPFCADFGPFNLGTTHHVVYVLRKALASRPDARVVFYTTRLPADVANAVFLLGAYLCIEHGATPKEAWKPFSGLDPAMLPPYRDATWAASTFDLYVFDCWAGLRRAIAAEIYSPTAFDKLEYFYYDHPCHGDMHEVWPGKFLAFRGPVDSAQCNETEFRPDQLVEVFISKGVDTIIRLNESTYDTSPFLKAGIKHYDMEFEDCQSPPDEIVDHFLRVCEEREGLVAVHCLVS